VCFYFHKGHKEKKYCVERRKSNMFAKGKKKNDMGRAMVLKEAL
jgi:hypothetical protein